MYFNFFFFFRSQDLLVLFYIVKLYLEMISFDLWVFPQTVCLKMKKRILLYYNITRFIYILLKFYLEKNIFKIFLFYTFFFFYIIFTIIVEEHALKIV